MSMHSQFMQIVHILAKSSKCVSFKVCAIAVRNGRIVGTGLNGTAPGYINCCDKFKNYNKIYDREEHHTWSLVHESHAEMALVMDCLSRHVDLLDTTVYVNVRPCDNCLKHLVMAGVKYIIYEIEYDKASVDSLKYAEDLGVKIQQFKAEV